MLGPCASTGYRAVTRIVCFDINGSILRIYACVCIFRCVYILFCFVLLLCFALLCFVLFPSVYCFSAFADRDGRRSASRVELSYVIWNGNPFPFTRFESACSHHTRIFHRTAAALPRQIRPFLRSTHTHTRTHARFSSSTGLQSTNFFLPPQTEL